MAPGEKGHIRIQVQNTGASESLGVTGALTTTHPSVTISDGAMLYFGDVAGGGNACGNKQTNSAGYCYSGYTSYPSFSVPVSVAVGTVIPFQLDLVDDYGNPFNLLFDYTVGQ